MKKVINTEYLDTTLDQIEIFIRKEMGLSENNDYLGCRAQIIIEIIKEE